MATGIKRGADAGDVGAYSGGGLVLGGEDRLDFMRLVGLQRRALHVVEEVVPANPLQLLLNNPGPLFSKQLLLKLVKKSRKFFSTVNKRIVF